MLGHCYSGCCGEEGRRGGRRGEGGGKEGGEEGGEGGEEEGGESGRTQLLLIDIDHDSYSLPVSSSQGL